MKLETVTRKRMMTALRMRTMVVQSSCDGYEQRILHLQSVVVNEQHRVMQRMKRMTIQQLLPPRRPMRNDHQQTDGTCLPITMDKCPTMSVQIEQQSSILHVDLIQSTFSHAD